MTLGETLAEHNASHPETRVELRAAADGGSILALAGELDMKASNDLGPVLEAVQRECPMHGRLYLDMAGIAYISSTGIGLLTNILARGKERSVSLVLVRVPAKVRKILDALGLLSFFDEEPEAPEARGSRC